MRERIACTSPSPPPTWSFRATSETDDAVQARCEHYLWRNETLWVNGRPTGHAIQRNFGAATAMAAMVGIRPLQCTMCARWAKEFAFSPPACATCGLPVKENDNVALVLEHPATHPFGDIAARGGTDPRFVVVHAGCTHETDVTEGVWEDHGVTVIAPTPNNVRYLSDYR